MAKIPFKVSARTARLIGGQNFSNAEGAIIELVKNCYDADARRCIVFFDNRFANIPKVLSREDYESLKKASLISEHYNLNDKGSGYDLDLGESKPLSLDEVEKNAALSKIEDTKTKLREFFNSQTELYIIDDGEGMTDEVIRDYWMVIGTNNKEEEVYTGNGRVKTGAKGIGRFALDRLGTKAEMVTKPSRVRYPDSDSKTGYLWDVDWNDFEGGDKTIGDIKANLIDVRPTSIADEVSKIVPKPQLTRSKINANDFKQGTVIKIAGLKENWDDFYVQKVFSSLEALIPPVEERKFEVFLFTTASPDLYGQVEPSICDDFDYKLTVSVNTDQVATISIFRNEYDLSKTSSEFFDRPNMQGDQYRKKFFGKDPFVYERKLSELVPGYKEMDEKNNLGKIGPFNFVLYFMKGQTAKKDKERFLYKEFDVVARRDWLAEFGGIKVFRDEFRVRPYGEPEGNAFDWLDLGSRAASSPAGIGKKGGGYKVRPNNVAGVINISRVSNGHFEDKSSREGIQENETFWVFKEIIIKLIEEFENDRSHIGRELSDYYLDTHKEKITEERVAAILTKITQTAKSKKPDEAKTEDEKDKEVLAQLVEQKNEEIEMLRSEQHLLKILASNALTLASFTHELQNIELNLVNRVDDAEKGFKKVVDLAKCEAMPAFLNPFVILQDIKQDEVKLKQWLGYSLGTLRKDKRRRKHVDLLNYFSDYEASWAEALKSRDIKFKAKLPLSRPLKMKVFEIDLDCIFNNLLTNSIEAFKRKDAPSDRRINLQMQVVDTDIIFTYQDSGPGLSKDIVEPEQIFEPHFTTKRDVHTGEDVGTGLGMWLVKSFVEDNKGNVELFYPDSGFGIKLHFPNKLIIK